MTTRRIFVDCETTGTSKASRLVELAYIVYLGNEEKRRYSEIVEPDGFEILQEAIDVHGITNGWAKKEGLPLKHVLRDFNRACEHSDILIAHNSEFDTSIILNEMERTDEFYPIELPDVDVYCTMKNLVRYCGIKRYDRNGIEVGFKWPSLQELYRTVFEEGMDQTHRALDDIEHLSEIYFRLLAEEVIEEVDTDE